MEMTAIRRILTVPSLSLLPLNKVLLSVSLSDWMDYTWLQIITGIPESWRAKEYECYLKMLEDVNI